MYLKGIYYLYISLGHCKRIRVCHLAVRLRAVYPYMGNWLIDSLVARGSHVHTVPRSPIIGTRQ